MGGLRLVVVLVAAGLSGVGVGAWAQAPAGAPPAGGPPAAGAQSGYAPAAPGSAADAGPQSYETDAAPSGTGAPDALEAQRLAIWNSPEMVDARRWVEEYGRRSVQFSPEAAQRYLARVRELSPDGMRQWLAAFEQRRAITARGVDVDRSARQTLIGRALAQQEARRQALDQAALGPNQTAETARGQRAAQNELTNLWSAERQSDRRFFLEQASTTDYSWIIWPSYRTRAAAAATLPGDLPAGDPRNFIRGDTSGAVSDFVGPNGEPTGPGGGGGAGAGGDGGAGAGGGGGAGGGAGGGGAGGGGGGGG